MILSDKIKFVGRSLKHYWFKLVCLFVIITTTTFVEAFGIWLVLPFLEYILGSEIDPQKYPGLVAYLNRFSPEYHLHAFCFTVLAVILCKASFTLFETYYASKTVTDLRENWETGVMRAYLYGKFEYLNKESVGKLLNNIINESAFASKAVRDSVDFFSKGLLSISVLSLLLSENWQLTSIVLLIVTVLLSLIWKIIGNYSTSIGKMKIKTNQSITAMVSQYLRGVRQVKVFSGEDKAISQYKSKIRALFRMIVQFSVITKAPHVIGELLMYSLIVIAVLYHHITSGGAGSVSLVPKLGFFVLCFERLFTNIFSLVSQRMSVLSYVPSFILVNSIIMDSSIAEDTSGENVLPKIQNGVSLENISFKYPGQESLVVDEFSMELKKGKVVAIAGMSGSGKSTICDIVAGFYKPISGKICIDGVDISGYSVKSWRSALGYVSQDIFLFDGTIRDNLLVGKKDANDSDIQVALEQASVWDHVKSLPRGVDEQLDNSGSNVSGGQRQRLAIARALIRDSQLLLLDEATSSLDKNTERSVMSVLMENKERRCTLIITHNPSVLREVDVIYVLDKGHLVDVGTYDELISACNTFRSIVLKESQV